MYISWNKENNIHARRWIITDIEILLESIIWKMNEYVTL